MRLSLLLPGLALLGACAGISNKIVKSDDFEAIRAGGYRIAIMPFEVSAAQDGFLTEALGGLGDLLALESVNENAPHTKQAATIMRRAFTASLAGGPFQVADLWSVDTELKHAGFSDEALQDQKNAARIAQLLDVDGVLYGDVIEWNRSYYVAQSVQSVGLRVTILDRRRKEVIYRVERIEQDGSGLTGGPTGYISAATSPIAGLKGSTLAVLARTLARSAASELSGTDTAQEIDATNARGDAPRVVFTSVGLDHVPPLRAGETITVIAIGTPGADVRFDIGRYRTGIPMVQRAVAADVRGERATYTGEYLVQAGEKLADAPVYVTVRKKGVHDKIALRTTRRVPDVRITIDAGAAAEPR